MRLGEPTDPVARERGAAFAKAWADYLAALEQSRADMMADPGCADAAVRDAALFLPAQMQAAAFYMQIAPHTGYPLLQRTHVGEPIGLNWGMPNPDFDYRWAYLDGARRYRIHGPRKSAATFFDIIAFSGYFVDDLKTYFQGAINEFARPDGSIELFLGPKSKGPNHIDLDQSEPHNVLTLRETLEDWAIDQPTPLRIECIDPAETLGPFSYPETDLVARLERACVLVRNATRRTVDFYHQVVAGTGGVLNQFYVRKMNETVRVNNGHPDNVATHCSYHVRPGEALIIDTMMPRSAVYWGIQLADLWWRTTDFTWHHSSLNRKNGWFGPDGRFCAVVSHEDPGVMNWLDPVGIERGNVMLRVYKGTDTPLPETKIVPASEVLNHLPAAMPRVAREERRCIVAARTDGVLRRYGF